MAGLQDWMGLCPRRLGPCSPADRTLGWSDDSGIRENVATVSDCRREPDALAGLRVVGPSTRIRTMWTLTVARRERCPHPRWPHVWVVPWRTS
jgi:hypothetical protein